MVNNETFCLADVIAEKQAFLNAISKNMPELHELAAYDYELPPELIAQHPAAQRDASRLLVVRRAEQSLELATIRDLPDLLQTGDALVLNDSRVVPARLIGVRTGTGGKWEGLFLGRLPDGDWKLIGQTRGRLQTGETVTIPHPQAGDAPLVLTLLDRLDGGAWRARPHSDNETFALLDIYGGLPLPHYIHQGLEQPGDRERYQTVYAREPGSAAAPTAGLHLTEALLERCQQRGIGTTRVTLHVGLGTFRPVNVKDVREHQMHAEWCQVPEETARQLSQVRERGQRVVAVGTTSLRTLETAVPMVGWQAWSGESRLFVYPPYQFQAVDALLTNFHLPKSTLLMLVSAFAGYELTRAAYQMAIASRLRFFSYGDAMLIL